MPRDANKARISKQPGCWRVDGIGEIHGFNGRYPKTNVYMSGLHKDQIAKPLHSSSLNGEHQVIKDIPLNWIRELKTGSVWRGGERIYLPGVMDGQYEIDTRDIKIVRYSQPVELEGIEFDYALPLKAIQFGDNVSNLNASYLAIVPVLNQKSFTKYLAIPCIELFNFYICVSNRFCNSAITGSMDRYVEWKGDRLKVLKILSMEEQYVAYRSFFNKQGKSWFNYPRNSINYAVRKNDSSADTSYRLPVTIKASFPFKGLTKLTVAGKSFPYELPGGKQIWAIFVSNIISCSYEDGFDPVIESDEGGSANDPGLFNDEEGFYGEPEDDPFEDELECEENEGQEDELATTPSVVHLAENRFSVLGSLKFTRIRSGEDEYPVYPSNDHGKNGLHRPIDDATNNEGTNSFGSHVSASRDLEIFIAMVKQLRELTIEEEWEVMTRYGAEPIQIDGEVVNSFPLDKRKRSWKMIDAPDGGQSRRPRQIAWVEIRIPTLGYIYLMELELKANESGRSTLLVFRKDGRCMSNEDFKLFLGLVAVRNGWHQKGHEWKTEKVRNIAASYFENYSHRSLHHVQGLSNHEEASDAQAKEWAISILKSFSSELFSLGSVKSIRSSS
ncbi:hypothetical protein QWI17_19885 [Gilvimarinus sp. SDUM040013]|uniref:Transposase n=1 Tax=Gilvimarinus gilvus TaxID=3058038 RepID=A0ABU4S082_9GAMM|nr:hypothetical protein [Gilvimarinus sp. SDUM040013]MDO3388116.1 hypothetical protein [Gilvimarinus sp. SDUM040013]MDX6850309.1 hypothetical protein [Gilvimarinus sp. SDUM040013]